MTMDLSIRDIHAGFENGTLTAVELVGRYLERIQRYDKKLNAIITVNPAAAEVAQALDAYYEQNGLKGPLHGIPVIVKDNFLTDGLRTTAGSEHLKDFIPDEDATLVRKLRENGAILLAKANLHEFAIGGETDSSCRGRP